MIKKVLVLSLFLVLFATVGSAHGADIIGHSLDSAHEYRAAVKYVQVLDADVRFTKGDTPVISHGSRFQGRCNFPVKKYKWSKVRKLSAARGCDIVNLEYVLRMARDNGKMVSLELKDGSSRKKVKKIAKLLKKYGLKNRTTIYSFNTSTIRRIQKMKLGLKTGLNSNTVPSVATVRKYGGRVALNIHNITPQAVATLVNTPGIYVAVFTINSPAEDAKFATLGADGVYTDTPVRTKYNIDTRK